MGGRQSQSTQALQPTDPFGRAARGRLFSLRPSLWTKPTVAMTATKSFLSKSRPSRVVFPMRSKPPSDSAPPITSRKYASAKKPNCSSAVVPPPNWTPSPSKRSVGAIGASRPFTTFATSPSARMPRQSAPATRRKTWLPSAIWSSASVASRQRATTSVDPICHAFAPRPRTTTSLRSTSSVAHSSVGTTVPSSLDQPHPPSSNRLESTRSGHGLSCEVIPAVKNPLSRPIYLISCSLSAVAFSRALPPPSQPTIASLNAEALAMGDALCCGWTLGRTA